jgi:hypothetical protein
MDYSYILSLKSPKSIFYNLIMDAEMESLTLNIPSLGAGFRRVAD